MSSLRDRRRAAARARLEASIESAIALLDQMDGDTDFEAACDDEGFDSDREASLCGVTFGTGGSQCLDGEADSAAFNWDQRIG